MMDENKVKLFDVIVKNLSEYMNNPKISFVLGGLFFLGFFFYAVHNPTVKNYNEIIARNQKDIDLWKNEYLEVKDECEIKLKEAADKLDKSKEESLNDIMKTNMFLQDLKSDKTDKTKFYKIVSDLQNEKLK